MNVTLFIRSQPRVLNGPTHRISAVPPRSGDVIRTDCGLDLPRARTVLVPDAPPRCGECFAG